MTFFRRRSPPPPPSPRCTTRRPPPTSSALLRPASAFLLPSSPSALRALRPPSVPGPFSASSLWSLLSAVACPPFSYASPVFLRAWLPSPLQSAVALALDPRSPPRPVFFAAVPRSSLSCCSRPLLPPLLLYRRLLRLALLSRLLLFRSAPRSAPFFSCRCSSLFALAFLSFCRPSSSLPPALLSRICSSVPCSSCCCCRWRACFGLCCCCAGRRFRRAVPSLLLLLLRDHRPQAELHSSVRR